MKFILAAAAFIGVVSARPDSASIRNNCKYPIYVQSIQFGGQPHGNPISVPPGGKYYEPWNNKGVALKVDKSRTFQTYLEFDYSTNTANNYGYYRFKNADGKNDNPFSHEHNVIDPGNGCKKIDCRAGDAKCYKRPTEGCPKPLDIVVTICSK